MYNTFIPINHERITMNIENTPYGLKLGSEYGYSLEMIYIPFFQT